MKNLYFFLLASLIPAFSLAQNNISAPTWHYLKEIKSGSGTPLPDGFVYKYIDGAFYVSALVKVHTAAEAASGLRQIGAFTGTKAGDIWTVQVPVDKVPEFIQVAGISYYELDQPVFPNLIQARKTTRVDSVHSGIGLPLPYSGKNVVMGVIDFGFDYNHPTLYDTLGNAYRVKQVWELNTNGTPPVGYAYGHEITDTNLIKAQGTDNPDQTHGTGVAGIAAGSGYGSLNNSRLRGMAFESEMVFVGVRRDSIGNQWMTSGFTDFLDGVSYIFDYATNAGKPCVVNISWGAQSGPHDGTTLFNQGCDNLSGPGKIVVMSAGNEGEERIHLTKTFTPTDTVLNSFLTFTSQAYKRTWVDIWGEPGETFCAKVTLYSGGNAGNTTQYICIDNQTHFFDLVTANGLDTCTVEVITNGAEFNGKPRITLNIFNHGTDTVGISIQGTDGTIHVWDEYYYYGYKYGFQSAFSNLGYNWATTGNTAYTVSDMGAAQSVLLVGAYASKVNFSDINGNSWSYNGYVNANKLVPFSSRGPMVDGRIKPDICAPGLTLATAFSSYDTAYTPTGTNSSLTVSSCTDDSNRVFYYGEFSGTSASSPAAAGIVALMLQEDPTLTPAEAKTIIFATAIEDNFTTNLPPEGNNNWGHGKINAYRALLMMTSFVSTETHAGTPIDASVFPNPSSGNFTLHFETPDDMQLQAEIIDVTGKTVDAFQLMSYSGMNAYPMNLSNYPAGLYLIKLRTQAGQKTMRLVIE